MRRYTIQVSVPAATPAEPHWSCPRAESDADLIDELVVGRSLFSDWPLTVSREALLLRAQPTGVLATRIGANAVTLVDDSGGLRSLARKEATLLLPGVRVVLDKLQHALRVVPVQEDSATVKVQQKRRAADISAATSSAAAAPAAPPAAASSATASAAISAVAPAGSPPAAPSPKRARTEQPLLSAADAKDLAARLATPGRFQRHQAGVKLLPADALAVQRYEHARKSLRYVEPTLLGFRVLDEPSLLCEAEASRLLAFCKAIEWEPRLGSGGRPLDGTQRKSFGVATDAAASYRVASGSATPLPPPLAALGERVLRHCRALRWEYAATAVEQTSSFEQAISPPMPSDAF